ncbi:MAG TPA: sigma-70 family RNA polymerase sigma factor [Isosphaeraceae bacterium]|nr:sigma-70 family RNA polymerase sigma factor [Isosphaeraceae bacterium]
MGPHDPETEALIRDAVRGDERARHQLLDRHRGQLRRMVALRLDRRLAPRLDPSDIVQEALADAAGKLDDYLRDPPLPFYPWLHRLAAERLVQAHRRHLKAQARTVGREHPGGLPLPDESALQLAERLVASGTSPSRRLLRDELRQQVRAALMRLAPNDREVLVMCYLEGLAFAAIAAILGITENAAKVRHFRALERIRKLMEHDDGGELGR